MRAENQAHELQGNATSGALQRVGSLGEPPLAPRQKADRTGIGGFLGLRLFVPKEAARVSEIVLAPAGCEQAGVAHHLEVLVRDVSDQSTQEGEHRQCLVGGSAALCIVVEGKADSAALGVVVGDAVLGQNGSLGVAANVAQSE